MQRLAAALAALISFLVVASASANPIDPAERAAVVRAAIEELERSYVFPEVAARMGADLRERERAGEYASLVSAGDFARKLTTDLQAVSRDRHLRVFEGAPATGPRPYTPPANHGFEKVERLPGNIGYVEVRSFLAGVGPAVVEATAEAMGALADADALIVDLRRNGGGSPHMVALVSSYLFDGRVHLNSLYWREGDRTDEFWTSAEVRGKRFGQAKPVYVLTSERTFSGAEEFTYNLKNLKRATIVGERTGGGAHPGAVRKLSERFSMFVPTGRAVSPITGTNWEGTGVAPDVEVPADQALQKALELAARATARAS